MKKVILSAFCLTLGLASVNAVASNNSTSVIVASFEDGGRKVIKSEELPSSVQTALKTDAYKGWAVKEAAVVNAPATADQAKTPDVASYYEVVLANDKETKTIKFHADGSVVK